MITVMRRLTHEEVFPFLCDCDGVFYQPTVIGLAGVGVEIVRRSKFRDEGLNLCVTMNLGNVLALPSPWK